MKTTNHCRQRQQQRHIPSSMVEIALYCADEVKNSDKLILRESTIEELETEVRALIERIQMI